MIRNSCREHLLHRLSGCKPQGTRSISLPSPKVKRVGKPVKIPTVPTHLSAPIWPVRAIEFACHEGRLRASVPQSIALLKGIWTLVAEGKASKTNIASVLSEIGFEPKQLTSLAQVLIFTGSDKKLASLGFDLLSVSSELGDGDAALTIVDFSLEYSKNVNVGIARHQKALNHVKNLADQQDLQALVMMGKLQQVRGEPRDAFKFFQKALSIDVTDVPYDKARSSLAEAYRSCGRLASRHEGLDKEVVESFEVAAFDYEDAYSFYYLALMRGPEHQDFVTLLLQAAISGTVEACYELGVHYSKAADEIGRLRLDLQRTCSMAREWFVLAMDQPDLAVQADLHLARIHQVQAHSEQPDWAKIKEHHSRVDSVSDETLNAIIDRWTNSGSVVSATLLEQLLSRNG